MEQPDSVSVPCFRTCGRVCQVPGHLTSQGAYRSEIVGIFATLQLCKKICDQFNVTKGALTLACNNIAASKSALLHDTYPDTKWRHFDILQAIYQLRKKLGIRVQYKHVEGHQSAKYPQKTPPRLGPAQ